MGRIIVVEDNPVYSTYVCTLLEKNGFQTRSAGSLSSARKLLAGCEEDDIILADLRLPDGESIGVAPDAECGHGTAVHCHDRLRRSAYGGGEHEARIGGLPAQDTG